MFWGNVYIASIQKLILRQLFKDKLYYSYSEHMSKDQ